jgi:hypothetical protein
VTHSLPSSARKDIRSSEASVLDNEQLHKTAEARQGGVPPPPGQPLAAGRHAVHLRQQLLEAAVAGQRGVPLNPTIPVQT